MSAMDRIGLEKKARKRILITGVIGIVLILKMCIRDRLSIVQI